MTDPRSRSRRTRGETAETLVLSASDVRDLLDLTACIDAVESAFRAEAAGGNGARGVLGCAFEGGGFHVKAAGLAEPEGTLFAAKINANFPGNPRRFGLPTIQGAIALFDGAEGTLLAVLDSAEVTALRTAAATAVAAKRLARPDSSKAGIVGCGAQSRAQLRALVRVLPISSAFVFDLDRDAAARFAAEMSRDLSIAVRVCDTAAAACLASDAVVTCTPSREPFLGRRLVRPGTFVAAVGADDRGKQELESELVASATLVVDVLEQCAAMGELRHAIEAGLMTREAVHADLAGVVSGERAGRVSNDEVTIFDSTGTALEDAAAAAVVWRRALETGAGVRFAFRG